MLDLLRQSDAALTAALAYDYDRIPDPDDRAAMRQAAIEIKPRLKRAATDILEAGQQLLDVRDRCPHGQWGAWLVTEFDLSETMARNWMNAAERFGDKSAKFADLPLAALYQLSAPSTPAAAVAAIEDKIARRERVGVAEVKATIAQHKPAPTPAQGRPMMEVIRTEEEEDADERGRAADAAVAMVQAEVDASEWPRLQWWHRVLAVAFSDLTQAAPTAESYGFGVETERLLAELRTLRDEVKRLTPGDRLR